MVHRFAAALEERGKQWRNGAWRVSEVAKGNLARCILWLLIAHPAAPAEVESIPCGRLRLGFDRTTGQWCELALGRQGENLLGGPGASDLEVIALDHPWPAAEEWQVQPPTLESALGGWRLQIVRRHLEWTVTSTYQVSPAPLSIRRQNTARWEGTKPLKVVGTILRVPGVTLGGVPDACWSLPSNYPATEKLLSSSGAGRSTREQGRTWSDTGLAYVYSEAKKLGVLAGYVLAADQATVLVEENVLGFLRFTPAGASVVAINFGPAPSSCQLKWPEPLAQRWPICQDAVTGTEILLTFRGGTVRLRSFRGHPGASQNPFLLDGGNVLHFFFAALNGGAVSLSAHEEWTASLEIVME